MAKTMKRSAKMPKAKKKKPSKGRKARATARKTTRAAKKSGRASARKAAKTSSARKSVKASRQKPTRSAKASTRGKAAKAAKGGKAKTAKPPQKRARTARPVATPRRAPTLDRERRTIHEEETHGVPSSLDLDRTASSVRTGRSEYAERLRDHTSTGPAMTGGDVDADWEDAETVGDEAPGGDNPTPDQDVVEEIGRALGIEYADNEELQGGDEIVERDRHRWELDPASREDYDEES